MIPRPPNRRSPRRGSSVTTLVSLVFVWLVLAWPINSVYALHDEPPATREPIPEKLVVLTFDDSARSHFDVVRPILLKYGFGATFFITEGFDFATKKPIT